MNIILCGYKSCGKTTIAKAFCKEFCCGFIDTDNLIAEAYRETCGANYTISEIYDAVGKLHFRQLEENAISHIGKPTNMIIATGGGAVMSTCNVKHLKSLGKIIYIHVDRKLLRERLLKTNNVPSFINKDNKEADLSRYLASRDDVYQKVSDCVINTKGKKMQEIIYIINQYRCNYGK